MQEVLEKDEVLVDEKIGTSALVQTKKLSLQNKNIKYIVLAVNNPQFKLNKQSFEIKVFGKTMVEWVQSACEVLPVVIKVDYEHNPVQEIKPYLDESEWTVVLYSDTPLLTQDTVAKCFDFAESKQLNVCRLKRGFIFKTDYVKRIEEVYGLESCNINASDFAEAYDFASLNAIQEQLKNRILDFHFKNGVQIVDKASVYIESEVSIGAGSVIYPNNTICGNSEIGENVQLFAGNRILNSIVEDDCVIEGCTISNSVIGEHSKVKGSTIGNEVLVRANCKINDGAVIKESVVEEECKIFGATIKGAYISKNCKVYDGAKIAGKGGNIVLKNNAIVGENSVISVACEIGEAQKITAGTVINK